MEFQPFPKMARLVREVVITEKIDGTNAQIVIASADEVLNTASNTLFKKLLHNDDQPKGLQS